MDPSSDFPPPARSVDEKDEYYDKTDLHVDVDVAEVDTGAQLVAGKAALDPYEAQRIKKKIDLHLLPLMCLLYAIQYMDKATLGNAAALNLREDTHLSTDEYNWLGTVFYLSYLVFEFPQNLALQRFPVGKWLSINIFVWAVALCCHAACKNFSGLLIVRLILGVCEGSITTGFMIVSSMFYTRSEQTLRVGYWFLMNGTAQIISGFISFGTLHMKAVELAAWQWLFIIMGAITVVTAVIFWFLFPDSPTTAWFLTQEERAQAVQRIKENQTGVENKHFKREQMIEAFTDPKIWLFALFSVLTNIPNSLSNQRQIIILSFGFNQLQTTLLGCVDGIVEIITIWTGTTVASRVPNSRGYVAAAWMTPNLLAVFLINFLPWDNKVGLLISLFISGVGTTAFVISLSWISSVTAGHTKRITVNTIMLSAYCVGNAVGPFMWQEQYKPRNHVPWAVIGVCIVCRIVLMLTIRAYLFFENKRRDGEERDTTYDEVYIDVTKDGVTKKIRLDKEYLDLTDIQNRDFRYVL